MIHELTTYAAGSGIVAGTSSVTGDTIIGAAGIHQIEVVETAGDGSAGTIRLNGGNEYNFTSADTDLRVEGPEGEVIYVDTTSIAPNFNGTVDITADGSLSTDGGNTRVAIDFSSNQVVIDSQSNAATNVDSTQIRFAGTEQIDFTGTSNAISALMELASDLRNERNLNPKEWEAALSRRGKDLERHAEQILATVGEQSASLEALVSLGERNRDYHLDVASIASDVEEADLTEVIIKLQQEQVLLQHAYAASATVLSQNILDYLR